MMGENINSKKEIAKADFIEAFHKLPLIDPNSLPSVFIYMGRFNVLLDEYYETAFNEGFKKAVDIDVK